MPWPWKLGWDPSRSLEMSPFDRARMTSYWHSIVTMALSRIYRFWDIQCRKMSWPWNRGQRSLKVIGTDTYRSATYDFLLTFHSNHWPISHRFRDKRRFRSKIPKFSHPVYFEPMLKGFLLELGIGAWCDKN